MSEPELSRLSASRRRTDDDGKDTPSPQRETPPPKQKESGQEEESLQPPATDSQIDTTLESKGVNLVVGDFPTASPALAP